MSLFDDVSAQMKDALRARDKVRLTALRSVRALFLNELKQDGSDSLSDEVCIGLVRRLEKQRKESIEAFEKAGREDRAEAERAEMAILQELLPSLADEQTTRRWVEQAIAASGAQKSGDAGRVMGALMKAHRGEVDGALAKRLAEEALSG